MFENSHISLDNSWASSQWKMTGTSKQSFTSKNKKVIKKIENSDDINTIVDSSQKTLEGTFTELSSTEDPKSSEYVYVIREREFIKTSEPVYKIGRTKQNTNNSIRRFDEYPKGSEPIFLMKVESSVKSEADMLKELKKDFKQRTDYGKEYFEGDVDKIILIIVKRLKMSDEKENLGLVKKLTKEVENFQKQLKEVTENYENVKNILINLKNDGVNEMEKMLLKFQKLPKF